MGLRQDHLPKLLWIGVITSLVLVAAFHPASRWRVRAVEAKLGGRTPFLSWVDLAAGLIPSSASSDAVRGRVQPIPPSWIKPLDIPREAPADEGWRRYPIFDDSTMVMERFDSHLSVLNAGEAPHPLHQHPEEELILVLSGRALITHSRIDSATASTLSVGPRQVVYHPAGRFHTITGVGPEPVVYLVFKWRGTRSETREAPRGTKTFDLSPALEATEENPKSMITRRVFSFPTQHLGKLHCHTTVLQPGGGYPPHRDEHEVAILVIEGTVVTLGERVGPNSVIFYGAHQEHGMKNVGSDAAKYIVFEFHGAGES